MLLGLIAFSSVKRSDRRVNDLKIEILDNGGNYFIDKQEVNTLINAEHTDFVLGYTLDNLQLKELEARVEDNAFVKDAQVYLDIKGNLQIKVLQARPLARVMNRYKPDQYIDTEGNILPVNTRHTARVPIVEFKKDQPWTSNIAEVEFGQHLLEMLSFIDQDEFWKAQVAHIIIDKSQELTILPQVTKQEIRFGQPTDFTDKFKKLKIFYKEVLPAKGWNSYEYVNVKFKNQIVCK
jgi:cell division protein FtsQ